MKIGSFVNLAAHTYTLPGALKFKTRAYFDSRWYFWWNDSGTYRVSSTADFVTFSNDFTTSTYSNSAPILCATTNYLWIFTWTGATGTEIQIQKWDGTTLTNIGTKSYTLVYAICDAFTLDPDTDEIYTVAMTYVFGTSTYALTFVKSDLSAAGSIAGTSAHNQRTCPGFVRGGVYYFGQYQTILTGGNIYNFPALSNLGSPPGGTVGNFIQLFSVDDGYYLIGEGIFTKSYAGLFLDSVFNIVKTIETDQLEISQSLLGDYMVDDYGYCKMGKFGRISYHSLSFTLNALFGTFASIPSASYQKWISFTLSNAYAISISNLEAASAVIGVSGYAFLPENFHITNRGLQGCSFSFSHQKNGIVFNANDYIKIYTTAGALIIEGIITNVSATPGSYMISGFSAATQDLVRQFSANMTSNDSWEKMEALEDYCDFLTGTPADSGTDYDLVMADELVKSVINYIQQRENVYFKLLPTNAYSLLSNPLSEAAVVTYTGGNQNIVGIPSIDHSGIRSITLSGKDGLTLTIRNQVGTGNKDLYLSYPHVTTVAELQTIATNLLLRYNLEGIITLKFRAVDSTLTMGDTIAISRTDLDIPADTKFYINGMDIAYIGTTVITTFNCTNALIFDRAVGKLEQQTEANSKNISNLITTTIDHEDRVATLETGLRFIPLYSTAEAYMVFQTASTTSDEYDCSTIDGNSRWTRIAGSMTQYSSGVMDLIPSNAKGVKIEIELTTDSVNVGNYATIYGKGTYATRNGKVNAPPVAGYDACQVCDVFWTSANDRRVIVATNRAAGTLTGIIRCVGYWI
jgi:hypothetical protein